MYPNPEQKEILDNMIGNFINDNEIELDNYINEINEADKYMDNIQTPEGFSEEHRRLFSDANNAANNILKTKNYVVINQVYQSHENILGQFINSKQTVNVLARSPKDVKKIIPIRKSLEYVFDHNKFSERILLPSLHYMFHYGLGWAKVWYNNFDFKPNGEIKIQRVSARDIILDKTSQDYFYEDTKFRIQRILMRLDDAKELFSDIDGFDVDQLKEDSEYGRGYPGYVNKSYNDKFCTIYYVEYTQKENIYRLIKDNDVITVDQDTYNKLKSDENYKNKLIKTKADVFYICYYNKGIKTFYHVKSPYQRFTLIPCINRRSDLRTYPIGDFTYYKNLQDLFNVLMSILVDDTKEGRKWLLGVDPNSYTAYKDEISRAISEGEGVIPTVSQQLFTRPGVSSGVLNLLTLVKQSIDYIRSLPSVARGELPAKQISEETVKVLMASAASSYGRKSVMINYFTTEIAKTVYSVMASMWDTQDWIRVTDIKPTSQKFIPINYTIEGEKEYIEFLWKLSGLKTGNNTEITPDIAEQFMKFKDKFEEEDSVDIEYVERVMYENSDQYYDDYEYANHIQMSGMTPTEFVEKYKVKRLNVPIYKINHLSTDADIDIEYVVDFDIERNKQRMQALTMRFLEMGYISPLDAMNEIGIEDAEGKYRRAMEQKDVLTIAEKLKSDPNFQQAVQLAEKLASNPQVMESINSMFNNQSQGIK